MSCDRRSCDHIRPKPDFLCNYPAFFAPVRHPPTPPCGESSFLFGSRCILPSLDDNVCYCDPRPLYKVGWVWIEVLRRILIPTAGGCAFSVVYAKTKDPPTCDESRQTLRASELPLYKEDKKCPKCRKPEEVSNQLQPSLLAETISCARKELWCLMEQARCISQQFVNYYETAKVHSESTLEFLREESNLMPRVGAIGIGGLTGYVFGLRRGPVMRAIYSTLGATAIAALCYPKETEEYSQQGLSLTKKYIIITYHFLNGDEVDYEKLEKPSVEEQPPNPAVNVVQNSQNPATCRCAKHRTPPSEC